MRTGQIIAAMCVGMLVAACADAPVPAAGRDVEFVRGCWVAKDKPGGTPIAFLRLLPDGAGAPTYAGPITDVRDGKWDVGTRYEFARDGSLVVVTPRDGVAGAYRRTETQSPNPTSDGTTRAAYTDGNQRLVIEGGNDRLVLAEHGSLLNLWEFERDGCD